MTFDEWWAIKEVEKADVPYILKRALKELAYEAWCASRYHQNLTSQSSGRDNSQANLICTNCKKLPDQCDCYLRDSRR